MGTATSEASLSSNREDAAAYSCGEDAVAWHDRASKQRNEFAQYRLAKLYLTGDGVPKDVNRAVKLLEASAEQGNPHAEYLLGKLYLQGEAVERDVGRAEHWFSQAAYQGHAYAQFFLDHIDEARKPSVMLAVTRLLHHLGNIFRENTPAATQPGTIHIDRKRRKELMNKRIAAGHKPDDHEEQTYSGPIMSAPW